MGKTTRTAVIGAGLTGLLVARRLADQGHDVSVLDKSRGLGGRLASRRTARGEFDHGCPDIQTDDAEFITCLTGLGAEQQRNRYFGAPHMSALVRPLAIGVSLVREVRILRIRKTWRGWHLYTNRDTVIGPFDKVVLAIPAPQACDILRSAVPELAAELQKVRMAAIWTCMASFKRRLPLPDQFPETGDILRADRGTSKPGRPQSPETWVIHMTPKASAPLLEMDRNVIAPELLERFCEAAAVAVAPALHLEAHRWLYAFASRPLGRPFAASDCGSVITGGDWALGTTADHAFQSAHAMADALLSNQAVTA